MAKTNAGHNCKWTTTEWTEFDRLTSELSIGEVDTGIPFPFDGAVPVLPRAMTLGGLLNLGAGAAAIEKRPEELREERLSALWIKVKAHSVYKRLNKDENFLAALKVFRKRQNVKADGYAGPYAELRLLNTVAEILTHQANFPDVRPKFASRATNKAALAASKKLLSALDDGVGLERWPDDGALRDLLTALAHKLASEQVSAGKRKRRSDDLLPQRWYLDGLINRLLRQFKDASPTIVASIAAMMGYSVEASTIDRRIKDVKAKRARETESRNVVSPLAYLPKLPVKCRGS